MKKYCLLIITFCVLIIALTLVYGCEKSGSNQDNAEATDQIDDPTESPTATPVPRDISGDSPIARSIVYSNELANKVQAYYETSSRGKYIIENTTMRLVHDLTADNNKGLASFSNLQGKTYFTGSMDAYVIDTDGNEWTERYSLGSGRVNTTRLGYYYYESHIRDLGVGLEGNDKNFESVTDVFDVNKTIEAHDGKVQADNNKGTAAFTVESTYDPYFVIKGFSVPTSKVNSIEITMAVNGGASSVELFINDGSGYNQKQSLKFSVVADGTFHTYLVDISSIQSGAAFEGARFDIGENVGEVITVSSVRAVKTSSVTPAVKTEKTYHIFSDKLHQEFRIVAYEKNPAIAEFGMVWKVSASTVNSIQIRDKNGIHNDLVFDNGSVEYVAFDFIDAGVCGIIIPNDTSMTQITSVELTQGQYVIRQVYAGKLTMKSGGDARIANRLYNDTTHSFDGIDREAYLERNPLGSGSFTVLETNSKTRFKSYDVTRGVYVFSLNGSTFNTAYEKANRNNYFSGNVSVQNDDNDRKIYLDFNTSGECLECGAILDENGMLVPIPMEVCKNFTYEKEEPVYDPADVPYSDTFFPVSLAAGEELKFTQMHLYMNWGIFPLKQVSSIQFHVSYYHLSTGVTESNCIAPYYVYGRDGWTLPDFRGASGIMWASQPQFTAGGHNKFVSYEQDGKLIRAEYTGSNIKSYGPVYADLEYSYVADSGAYEYTLRHMEFPQTDENRVYYTLSLKFLKDLTIEDVKNDFTLHYFDSRDQKFDKLSYMASDGSIKTVNTDFSKAYSDTVTLSKNSFWFALYGSNNEDCMNEAYIMKNYEIVLGGKVWDGNFVLREGYDGNMYNITELSLDLGKHTFKKGDTIYLEFMLVPWGNTDHNTYSNIERIYEDSVLKPLAVTAVGGTVIDEPYLPHIECVDNYAEFTVTGGRDKNAVRIDGFTSLSKPVIEKLNAEGNWELYDTSVKEFDGYGVQYILNGTYAYTFIFEQQSPDDVLTFRIRA